MTSYAEFTAAELAEATGGCWRNNLIPAGNWKLNTDSRSIQAGECFIPIVGERFNGHDFLAELPAGVIALAERQYLAPGDLPVLEVADTLNAYQTLARFHRLRMKNLQIAAVTGSVGKTSVKEMLRAIFTAAAGAEHVLYTIGNTNNQIGVPQNLLRLTPDIKYAVIEMGTNHHGEISPLSLTALPDTAIINTIAACHLEHLGTLEGVAQEKSAIFNGLNPHGTAVYPQECAGVEVIKQAAEAFKQARFGNTASAAVSAEYIAGSLNGSRVALTFHSSGKRLEFDWKLTGVHQAENASAAAAAAEALNLAPEIIVQGLQQTELPGKRMNSTVVNNCCWINDAYNANPHSMKSSLRCIKDNADPDSKLLLVLGDMLELGSYEERYHGEILQFVRENFAGFDYQLLLLGKRFRAAAEKSAGISNCLIFDTLEDLQTALPRLRQPGMTVFLKSSNSVGLSKIEPC